MIITITLAILFILDCYLFDKSLDQMDSEQFYEEKYKIGLLLFLPLSGYYLYWKMKRK